MKLTKQDVYNAIVGGTILGGGGGGDAKKGEKYALLALENSSLELVDIDSLNDEDILITASLVGAPNAENQYMTDKDIVRTVELIKENYEGNIAGIITNEQGGEATTNGWLQAARLGIALVDAPCNGRAHPTGVMGSINLHKISSYTTVQACVGGNPKENRHIEAFFEGSIEATSRLVRQASIEAGGLVAVARNPVKVSYAKENCAVGAVKLSIEIGKVFNEGLKISVEEAVKNICTLLNGDIIVRGEVDSFSIKTQNGFDIGYAMIDGFELTFWNEYITAEKTGVRYTTFPDLIMTIDAKTGTPLSTAMMKKGVEVYVIAVKKENLILSATMKDEKLLKQVEEVIGKKIIRYL